MKCVNFLAMFILLAVAASGQNAYRPIIGSGSHGTGGKGRFGLCVLEHRLSGNNGALSGSVTWTNSNGKSLHFMQTTVSLKEVDGAKRTYRMTYTLGAVEAEEKGLAAGVYTVEVVANAVDWSCTMTGPPSLIEVTFTGTF